MVVQIHQGVPSFNFATDLRSNATLAQLVERVLGKDEVIGSIPMGSSKFGDLWKTQ